MALDLIPDSPDSADAPPPDVAAAGSTGTSGEYAREDHTHGGATVLSSTTPDDIQPDDSGAVGIGTTAARADHQHANAAAVAGSISPDDSPAEGVSTSFSRADHRHGIAAATAGNIAPDDAAAEGVSTSFARADHVHSNTAAVAGSIAPDDTPSEGVATSFARSDHRHGITAAPPVAVGTANAEGAGSDFARSSHVHDHGTQSVATQHAVSTFTANGFQTSEQHIEQNSIDGRNNAGANKRVFRPGDYMVGNTYDPTGAANSSTSFAAMIAALVAFADRAVIELPPGVFKVDPGVITGLSSASCGIIGPGRGNCVFVPSAAGNFITLPSGLTGGDAFTIRGFTIYNTSGTVFTSGAGINVNGCDGVDISEVAFIDLFEDINVNGAAIKVSMQKIVSFNTNGPTNSVGIVVNNGDAGDTYIGPDVVMSDGGGTTRRRACVEIIESGHYEITQCNLTGSRVGILIDPGTTDDVSFGFHNQVLCDSNTVNGMQLTVANAAGSIIKNIKSVNSWYSGTVVVNGSAAGAGVLTSGGAAGIMNGVTFTNDRFLNNRTHGFEHTFGTDFRWEGCDMKGNSSAGSGVSDGLNVAANVSNWSAAGGKFGGTDQAPTGGNQRYGVAIAAGTSNNWSILGVDLTGNVTGPLLNGATGVFQQVKDCAGMADSQGMTANVAIANTETVVFETLVPKNSVRIGTTFEVQAGGILTNGAASTSTFRIRIGAATLGANIAAIWSAAMGATVRTNIPWSVSGCVTFKAIGAGGTIKGYLYVTVGNATIPVVVADATAAVAVDTTADRLIGLTIISGAATTTWTVVSGIIRPVMH